MASKKILLVDSDARSVRVLEVSLKKAGFGVSAAGTVEEALKISEQFLPDLVITESTLPDERGAVLCRTLRARPGLAAVGLLFLSEDSSSEAKIEAINVGADVFLAKPVLVKDIVVQIHSILEKRESDAIAQRDRPGNLSGTLANMGVVDVLQIMEAGFKSGIVHVSSDRTRSGGYVAEGQERGTIFFRDGQVIDARLGKLRGVEAVYRMLLWDDGVFEIEFKMISRDNVVRCTIQAILLEGMRRVDEWTRHTATLPPLSTQLTVDFDALGRAYLEVPADTKPVLHLFDGQRSLFDVINDAPLEDTDALAVVARLHENGVLHRSLPTKAPAPSDDEGQIEDWLSGPTAAAQAGGLPSALGRAMIPSLETPSQILQAADPLVQPDDEPVPLTEPRETQIPDPVADQPSLVLSRHTVPANRATPLTQTPMQLPEEPIPLTQPSTAPRLQIQRVSSVVSLPSRRASSVAQAPAAERIPLPRMEAISSPPLAESEMPTRDPSLGQTARIEAAVLSAAVAPEPTPEPVREPVSRTSSYVIAPAAPPPWPVASAPQPVAPSVSTESESEAPTPAPAAVAAAAAAAAAATEDTAPTRVPEAAEVLESAGFVDHSRPNNEATHLEAPKSPAAPAEVSNFSKEFFDKPASDDEMAWDNPESSLGSKIGTFAIVGVLVLGIGLLVFGGKDKPPETEPEKATTAKIDPAKMKPAAAWPKSPSDAVKISDGTAPAGKPADTLEPSGSTPVPPKAGEAPVGDATAAAMVEAPKPKAVPIKEAPVVDAKKAAALVKQGVSALQNERYKQARRSFGAALKAEPNNAQALAGLAQVYLDQEKLRTAKGYAWRALKQNAATPRAHLVLGMVAQIEGDNEKAKKSYQRFLRYESTGKNAEEIRRILNSL